MEALKLTPLRDQLRVSLINKMHGLFNYHGIKIKKEALTTKVGAIGKYTWDPLEKVEIEVISYHLEAIRESLKKLEKEIIAFAKQLPEPYQHKRNWPNFCSCFYCNNWRH